MMCDRLCHTPSLHTECNLRVRKQLVLSDQLLHTLTRPEIAFLSFALTAQVRIRQFRQYQLLFGRLDWAQICVLFLVLVEHKSNLIEGAILALLRVYTLHD